jgi:hypothetical protein
VLFFFPWQEANEPAVSPLKSRIYSFFMLNDFKYRG